ncbi:hypothetical protein KTQ42_15665|uniref:hypothetical protein n=1 Tax=Noviherbaspirillum sp. L7-7A TaxID=2850560 RepID=UPI001C2CA7D2|nr:hypothetical protein [Noviherbaspirillum sp. L7-7A]MBV0880739.1 hypothetical protein [Noviherbaspirillum sp. L7-7A]
MLSAKDKKGIWLFAGVLATLGLIFGVQFALGNKPKPGADNCIGKVSSSTVIVLDYTDQITDQTRDEIASRAMAHIYDKVKVNERVSIFTISDISKKSLKPLVTLCRPPDSGNRAIENVELIKRRFQKNFEAPIRVALSEAPSESKESPIAQALTDISLSHYLRSPSNTLLIFSDMLEHTSKFSLYKCASAVHTVVRYRESRSGAMERPVFVNTNVQLNLIPRLDQSKETLKCRDKLWPWFFGDNKGTQAALTVDFLPGGTAISSITSGGKK